jgi:YHYH protein
MQRLSVLLALTPLVACGGSTSAGGAPSADASTGGDDAASVDASTADANPALTALPIGDNRYSTSPMSGYVYSCTRSFGGAGGASSDGPWIDTDAGTFDFTAKIAVQGAVSWPSHTFAATLSGATRTITGNGLPDHTTGTFPIAKTDPAYAYDMNPNSIAAQTISWSLPATPTAATTPSCLDGGPIGILLTGAQLYDALDGEGRDAVAHEVQDACQAHPDMSSSYHYHSVTICIADPGTGHSALLGYARDGFGIYGVRGESGETLTNADLDACHGHTHSITWDGATVTLYHYHATYEFPYTVGCYNGTPISM